MKRLNKFLIGACAAIALVSCSDDSFNEFYENPSKTTKATCDRLMTGTFYSGNDYTFNAYWRVFTWDNVFGKYVQAIGYKNNTGSMYSYNDGYASDRWDNFYKVLAQFRQLEDKYSKLPAAEQEKERIYKDLAEVYVYDQLSQICDLFGDTPFTKAGFIGITGDLAGTRAAFDDDEQLYKNMLDRLGDLYTDIEYFQNNSTSLMRTTLTSQDFINKGDLGKWKAYANSLRLRLAVHVSAHGSLTTLGHTVIGECLSRDLVTNDANAIEVYADDDGFNYWENFRDGYRDINNVASQPMIDAMTRLGVSATQQDPRLKVIYSPNKDGNFIGTNRAETRNFQEMHGSAFNGFGNLPYTETYYAYLDSATYTDNHYFISPIVSAAEVDFLRAEAYVSGWVSGNAQQAFVDGILNSTKFYYRQNNNYPGAKGKHYTYPGDATVIAYANNLWNSYSNKLEAVMTQKWVHFGIIQPSQAWTDIRRTGYPQLSYPTDDESQVFKNIPSRIKYPNKEKNNNKENYDQVVQVQGDDSYQKLFWAQ